MSKSLLVIPDREVTEELIRLGGEDVKKCFQCATCSVVCDLTPDENPFPRKEMVWAQWGLKEKLVGDPDIWLCHRCADCTVHCPRDAKPSDVLAAARDLTIKHFAFPKFLGRAFARIGLLPFLLAIPIVLLLFAIGISGDLRFPEGEVVYGKFFEHTPLQIFFIGFTGLAIVAMVVGVVRFWRAMRQQCPPAGKTEPIVASVVGPIKDILTHRKFGNCTESKSRKYSHLLTMYGFLGLFVTTALAVFYMYVVEYYPLGPTHFVKILGNLSALAMIIGLSWIIFDRFQDPERRERSSAIDAVFIGILMFLVISGVATEILRYVDNAIYADSDVVRTSWAPVAYVVYFLHLVSVFMLLVYLPYSRFSHIVYRTVAMVYYRFSKREPT